MGRSPAPSVTPRPLNDLVKLAKSSDRAVSAAARWELIKRYEPLMRAAFKRLQIDWVPEAEDDKADERRHLARNPEYSEDARQAGWLGFLEAFERFDPDRGFPLGAFVRERVEGAIVDVMRKDAQYHSIREPLADFEAMPADPETQEMRVDVQEYIDSLTPRQRSVVELVGLGGMRQADAARLLGISREAVNKAWQKACSKGRTMLRAYAR